MTAGLFARVPAIAALVVVALLATATLTLAATSSSSPTPTAPAVAPEPATLVVPDVRHLAYVFAKGTLEQSGFSWKVVGSVQGYAANVVSAQTPAPGTRVVADGAPIIRLGLSRNTSYKQEGIPENESPYEGRPARLLVPRKAVAARKPAAANPKPVAKKPVVKSAAKQPDPTAKKRAGRKPAFSAPGAPPEPLDEITLVARVQQLDTWLDSHRRPSRAAVTHWLYQHNWVVTGAAFGWSGGPQALRALVAVDRRVQKLWGIGSRSEALARHALAEVERKARS
jgi:PASTA domain-containing protein